MTNFDVVITMAGKSSRFSRLGLQVPKWTLTLDSKSMLQLALESLASFINLSDNNFHFVTLKEHQSNKHIMSACEMLQIRKFKIYECRITPNGQAMSAFQATRELASKTPLIVWNIDTYILPNQNQFPIVQGNWMSLCTLPGTHWSFAKLSDGHVIEIAEKSKISDFASIGLYGFQSSLLFNSLIKGTKVQKLTEELYIAPLYNEIISRKLKVLPHFVDSQFVFPLGTPKEYLSSAEKLSRQIDIRYANFFPQSVVDELD